MAASVGHILRKARTQQGVELSDVERVTKIRAKFLLAMERDDWDALPGPAYARGFLSSYARFLGLDQEALVDRYRREFEKDRPERLPGTVIKPGSISRPRSARPAALVGAAVVAVLALVLVIAAALGGSENGGDGDRGGEQAARSEAARTISTSEPSVVTPSTTTTTTTTALASEVSLELRATDLVWVCLVDDRGRADVNSETLSAGERRGPFEGSAFEATFGNGSVELTVNGEAAKVPTVAEPLSYRITPDGARRLDPASGPSCT